MTQSAFTATFSDWKVIKTRGAVQLVFERPIEKADEAYQVLGGMPIAAQERWCAIARLELQYLPAPDRKSGDSGSDQGKQAGTADDRCSRGRHDPHPTTQPLPSQVPRIAEGEAERRSFNELKPSQQAGILCNERAFLKFMSEKFPDHIRDCGSTAAAVRELCKVNSRADITPDNAEWSSLVLAYRLWMREPSVVPA